jgi:hypothetical protein
MFSMSSGFQRDFEGLSGVNFLLLGVKKILVVSDLSWAWVSYIVYINFLLIKASVITSRAIFATGLFHFLLTDATQSETPRSFF